MAKRRDSGEGSLSWSKTHEYWEGQLPPSLRNTPGIKNFCRDKSKAEAREKLNNLIADAKKARASRVKTRENYTVRACVEDWLDEVKGLDAETIKRIRGQAGTWVYPRIGDRTLAEMTPKKFIQFFDDIAPDTGMPTMRHVRSMLRRSIDHARVGLIIDHNDVELVKVLPKAGNCPRPKGAMSRDQIAVIMDFTAGTRWHALFAVSIYLGLRPGELVKLRWDHLDLDKGEIRVWRATYKGEEEATKNPQSKRTLGIPRKALEALKEWRVLQQAEREAAGPLWHEHGLVFCYEDGRPYAVRNLRNHYEGQTRRAGLGEMPTYRGRHTFASVLFDADMSTEKIAPLMGHANSKVTETVYTHVIRPVMHDAADAIDDAFG